MLPRPGRGIIETDVSLDHGCAAGDDGNFIELSKRQNADFPSLAQGFDYGILSRFQISNDNDHTPNKSANPKQSQNEYSLEMCITGTIHYSAVPVPMQSRRLSCWV